MFALHGGSYSSRYFDLRAGQRSSALQNYADLGYRAIALDRPVYGAAADIAPEGSGFAAQAAILRAALAQLQAERGHGLPVFLVGHSIGGMVAMTMAAGVIDAPLRGVMASGIWASDEHAQRQARAALKAVDGATVMVQHAAGHCLDAHRACYAHHLATAAFFETCLAAR